MTTLVDPAVDKRWRHRWLTPRFVTRSMALVGSMGLLIALGQLPCRSPRIGSPSTPGAYQAAPNRLRGGRTKLPDGTVLDLSDQGVAEWTPIGLRRSQVNLRHGSLALAVTSSPAFDSSWEVVTPRYTFRPTAARCWIALSERATRLEVTEGQVTVVAGGRSVATVSAGQNWEGSLRDDE